MQLIKYFSPSILLIVLCIGCGQTNSEEVPEHLSGVENLTIFPSNVNPQQSIQFTRTQVFEESEDLPFGRISGIAVDKAESVYVSESTQGHAAIHVFEPDGTYLTSLGGYGEGPGEFRSIINPQIGEDKLYALDGRQLKVNVYSLQSLSFESSIQLDSGNWNHIEKLNGTFPADFSVLGKNKILISFLKAGDQKDILYRYMMDSTSEIISDMIIEQVLAEHFVRPDNRGIFHSPFSANGLMTVSNHSTIYTIWTEEILFKEYTIEGEYLSAFYHPYMNKKLDHNEVLNLYDSEVYRASVRNTGIPERWPAIHSVVMDDLNNFWISTIIEDGDEFEWWILNKSGEMISKFQWPKNKEIQIVKNGSAFVLETESESGLQKVVKYQFRLE
jgi:hypothetical protein